MNCRHCGSDNTISRGPCISCKDCGRLSMKILRYDTPRAEDRPACPECGALKPYVGSSSKGIRGWVCRVCGRNYNSPPEIGKAELSTIETVSKYCAEVQVE